MAPGAKEALVSGVARGLQWFGLALAAALAVLVLAVVTGWLWLISPPGERFLAQEHRIGPLPNGLVIDVAGFSFNGLGDLRVAELALSDPNGAFLSARNMRLSWEPFQLTRRQIQVTELRADAVQLDRRPRLSDPGPRGAGRDAVAAGKSGTQRLPDQLPMGLAVTDIGIDRLTLGQALVGQQRVWRVSGNLRVTRALTAMTTSLGAAPVAGNAGEGRLQLTVNPRRRHANGRLTWQEPADGPLAHVLDLPGRPAVEATLFGSGWLDDANAQLAVDAGEAGRLDATGRIRARAQGDYALDVDLEARAFRTLAARLPAPLAERLAPVLDGPWDLAADGRLGADLRLLEAESVALEIPGGRITGSGTYRLAGREMAAEIAVQPAGSQRYEALLPGVGWDDLQADLTVAGTARAPKLDVAVTAAAPRWQGWRAASLAGDLQARVRSRRTDTGTGPEIALTGAVSARGPDAPNAQIADLLADNVRVALESGRLLDGGTRVRASSVSARSGALSAEATDAHYDLATRTGEAGVTLAAGDMAALAPLLPGPAAERLAPSGRAQLTAQLEADGDRVAFQSEGHVRNARLGRSGLDAALAAGLELSANGAIDPDGVVLERAQLGVPALAAELAMSGEVGFGRNGPISATAELAATDLAAVRAAIAAVPAADGAGLPHLDGAATVSGELAGTLAAPAIRVQADAPSLRIAGVPVAPASLAVNLEPPLAAPSGQIAARITHDDDAYTARGDWQVEREAAKLRLPSLALTGPGADLSGDLAVTLAGAGPPGVSGSLAGRIASFARLGRAIPPLAGLAGGGRADVTLSHDADGQDAAVELVASDLRFARGEATPIVASEMALELDLADLYGQPSGSARFAVDNLVRDDLRLNKLDGRVDVGGGAWDVSVTAAGRAGRSYAVSAQATLQPFEAGLDARLQTFEGHYGDEAFSLAAPAKATVQRGDIDIPGVRLVGEAGAVELSLAASAEGLTGRLTLDQLPLGLVRLIEPDLALAGRLSGELVLSGTLADPEAKLNMHIRDLVLERAELVGLPPIQVRVSARLADDRARGSAVAYMPRAGAVKITAATAAPLDPETLMPQIRADQQITVRTDGELHLAALNDFVADRGIRARGDIALGLRLEGTLAEPALAGEADLNGGAVEMRAAGVQITDIGGKLVGNGNRLEVAGMSGQSPNGGRVSLAGGAAVLGAQALRGEIRVRTDGANVVARDDLNAIVDSDLSLAFGPAGTRVDGRVDVVRANYRIPGELPSQVVALDVTEVPAGPAPLPVPVRAPAEPANGPAVPARPPQPGPSGEDAAAPAAAPAIQVDLRVVASRRVFVRGRGLDLEMRSDLRLTGTVRDLAVRGELGVVRGSMDLLGQRFTFQEGQVSFVGGRGNDPELNLLATTQAQRLDVELRITGTVSQPELTLESQPEQPQEEILARLLFGRSVGELSAFEAVALANSTAALTGGGVGVLENLRQGLGVDRLTVRGEANGEDGEGETPTVGVGRYFGDNVFVDVEQQLDDSRETEVSVEVSLTRNIQLRTRVNQRAASRLGLNVEWDY